MGEALSRRAASAEVAGSGWRYVLGVLCTSVPVGSLAQAAEVAGRAVAAAGDDADGHLRMDVRRDRVALMLQSSATADVQARDVELARQITSVLHAIGLPTDATASARTRSVQLVEIGIDALDIAAIRPFWKAVLDYGDGAGKTGPQDALVDPFGQGPAIWFQQMDAPRPQRNRIHLDISVPDDEAPRRVRAALNAGGVLVNDTAAPSFWVLADVEGNEACVTTWQGRDG